MHTVRSTSVIPLLLTLMMAAGAGPGRAGEEAGSAAADEQPWITVLRSDAPKAEKAIACKKLAIWGTARAVPALAALLPDEELSSWARIALEAIPDPAADRALREAMATLEGRTLIGVINSIGVRRDPQAVDGLIQRLEDPHADVASAAAVALGKVGNAAATRRLRDALADAPAGVRSAVAEGCILCAERLLAGGRAADAAALYDEVRRAEVPRQRVIEAIRGAILARRADGVPLLVEQLKSSDRDRVAIGLTAARELSGAGVTELLVDRLDELEPARRALLILALADRGDPVATPAMLEAVRTGTARVRVAAVAFLQKLGDASCVPTLLEVATDPDPEVAAAARNALEALPGEEVDDALASRLERARGEARRVLIELVGRRRIAAVPALLAALDDADPELRAAALTALGEVATLEDLPVLIRWVVAPPRAIEAVVAQRALRAAAVRMPDREACAARLAEALDQAPLPAKTALLETLAATGGQKALEAIAAAASAEDRELQDVATRLLGSWMTIDAAPVLLELARQTDSEFQVRALRGFIRLARQFPMPDQQRVAICRDALEAAQRDAERRLVLEVIQRYPSVAMLRLAVQAAQFPGLRNEANGVALSVAQKIGGSADAEKLLEQLGQKRVEIEILKAEYGAGKTHKDVTAILRRYVRDFPLIVLPSNRYNAALGGDPVPGVVKQLTIQYRVDGKRGVAVFTENDPIFLPVPE